MKCTQFFVAARLFSVSGDRALNPGSGLIVSMRARLLSMQRERVSSVTCSFSPVYFYQNDRGFWEGDYSLLCFVIHVDVYCISDVPGMGIYFFSYEWVLNKLTLEGERFVEYRCLFVSSCRPF